MVKEKYLPYEPPVKKEPEPPKTFREKLENFWYYHKTLVLLVGGFAIALILGIYLAMPDHSADLSFELVTPDAWAEDHITLLEEFCTPYLMDRSGDSVVYTEAKVHTLQAATPTTAEVEALRKAMDESGTFAIVCKKETVQALASAGLLAELNTLKPVTAETEMKDYAFEWTGNNLFAKDYYYTQWDEPYYFCMRYVPDDALDTATTNTQYWSSTMIRLLGSNQPIDEDYYKAMVNYQNNCWKELAGTERPE